MAKKNHVNEAAAALHQNSGAIKRAVKGMQAYERMGDGLAKLNTMRGGTKGFKGFVMEELEAGHASALGRHTEVINNNGIADLRYIKSNGTEVLQQVKSGYKPKQIDFGEYAGQEVLLDKGNAHLQTFKEAGNKVGVKVRECHVTDGEAKKLADFMQRESRITGNSNAPVTSHLYSGAKRVSTAHSVGMKAAKSGAIAGAGFSLGSNIVEVVRGKKTVGEAAGDVVVDTAKAGVVGYGAGAVGSVIASTAAGAAAIETAGAAAAVVTSAPVIGTAITTGAAAVGTAAATISAGAGAATAAIGLTAAAPIVAAAAPFVAAGAAIGVIGSFFFGDD
ncbi:hypothetical protein [Selenomonas ruminantium]|uniref:Uncharacterized protein n=1 Tax=Selenomonas ruminantium TaxID=971 RepID=A0A1H0NJ22_SELRU|nr:hypothetical protein [Selenomonas ruminantium]SDO92683.1 hypothetical protein SAMN05216366_10398 [Selenomonas ruminantium]